VQGTCDNSCKFTLTACRTGVSLNPVNDGKTVVQAKQPLNIKQEINMNKRSNSMALKIFAAVGSRFIAWAVLPLALSTAALLTGCQSQSSHSATDALKAQAAMSGGLTAKTNELMNLREGDVLKISFPGSPSLDTTQTIRRDGKISLQLVGDVDAAGMTPSALEKKLVDLYAPQISSKQVTVQVVSSSLSVYVTGMVLRPGKVLSDHPITALEAVMEAGGFDYTKANTKNVTVIRQEGNVMKNYKLNLNAVLMGEQHEPFYLKPDDIVYVPEKFTWF
jgi:polysaccharide biosynthesis/export protein